MDKKIIEFNKNLRGDKLKQFQAGDIVEVHLKIKEKGKERVQIFEGLIIAIKGKQSSSPTITVRKISHGVGVEMVVPILSENVKKLKFIKRAKVRRSKLYYVRGLTAKKSRMQYKDIADFTFEEPKKDEKEKTVLSEENLTQEEKTIKKEKKENPKKETTNKK
ncbi:MAG: 50S ribosomal protein L19 [Candidatus Moranbacteria bacterium CG08_land_8_20_14_0_20_34_16]|nr:MAG: 50S ribosomal protein L19 [Candidatus Moranbacteria bacterium CG08_land_8_20_14_0_20_34_16]